MGKTGRKRRSRRKNSANHGKRPNASSSTPSRCRPEKPQRPPSMTGAEVFVVSYSASAMMVVRVIVERTRR